MSTWQHSTDELIRQSVVFHFFCLFTINSSPPALKLLCAQLELVTYCLYCCHKCELVARKLLLIICVLNGPNLRSLGVTKDAEQIIMGCFCCTVISDATATFSSTITKRLASFVLLSTHLQFQLQPVEVAAIYALLLVATCKC